LKSSFPWASELNLGFTGGRGNLPTCLAANNFELISNALFFFVFMRFVADDPILVGKAKMFRFCNRFLYLLDNAPVLGLLETIDF